MTNDTNIELSRRKILAGLGTIGLASAGAGAGTMALFSDEETSENNSISAGRLDMRVGAGGNANVNVGPIHPGESGTESITLKNRNNSTIGGVLDVTGVSVTSGENGRTDPEHEANDSTAGQGELDDKLKLRAYVENADGDYDFVDGAGDLVAGDKSSVGKIKAKNLKPRAVGFSVDPGETVELVVDWDLPESVGNVVQTDDVSLDLTFELVQGPRVRTFTDEQGPFTGNYGGPGDYSYDKGFTRTSFHNKFATMIHRTAGGDYKFFVKNSETGSQTETTVSSSGPVPFEFVYNGQQGLANLTVDGTSLGTVSVPEPTLGTMAITANSAYDNSGDGSVDATNVELDGETVGSGSLSTSVSGSGEIDFETFHVEGLDSSSRFVVTGTVDIEAVGNDGANYLAEALHIDLR
ncbi:SipW-cognate class signal peptide [Halogeometricum rufum]|uniref:SipW-cognate class signal peptide n=1 Tax=Halogeometricum rufum TaxID=553469 RepID=A0A1I6H061_9EURY|nr:TasA family protein [Halogeometricum rufum]SFR47812.1 SipW-cognate class signal peptide [Halogeometricum rufum]